MNAFVVTTSARGSSRTQIWHPEKPLALGHPFRWIMERTENGVRIRRLGRQPGEVVLDSIREIPLSELVHGNVVPLHGGLSLQIHPVAALPPAYEHKHGGELRVFRCLGGELNSWVIASYSVNGQYIATMQRQPIFRLRRKTQSYELHFLLEGIEVQRQSGEASVSKKFETLQIGPEEMADITLKLGSHVWRFGLTADVAIPAGKSPHIRDEEAAWFGKSLKYTALALALFTTMAWFWPKPTENPAEIIPPQFAKIVLQKTRTAKPAGEATAVATATQTQPTPEAAKPQPKKVQDAAVVQAFRAKALNNAVSGLLKGGMTKLLAQSEFVQGTQASANARRIFDAKSSSLAATAPEVGSSTARNVKVAAIGGSAGGVSYGKGEKAGVKGQGGAFVSMDIAGSSVEEGLTKDEVGEVIHRHMSEVRYCYESAMLRKPDIEGKLIVNFTIGAPGTVKSAEIKSSTLPDPRLDDCIVRRLVTWKFPQTKGGVDVAVSYPFIFKTLGR